MLGLPNSVRACLFDLDGVLTETASVGTRSFLKSRGITLPDGAADDSPEAETVHRLGNRKNEIVLRLLREAGRAGEFGLVVGVDRVGQAEALRRHGADIAVADLADLLDR